MSTVIVLGSRIYQPMQDIDRELQGCGPDTTVLAFGTSAVCERAILAATSLGFEARNVALTSHRRELVAAATAPDALVVLFVADDPDGSGTTEGMGQIATLLAQHQVAPRIVPSPLAGSVCRSITRLHETVDRATAAVQEHRRAALVSRALALAVEAVQLRDRYEQRLTDGLWLLLEDENATQRWLRWEACYRALHDATEDAKRILARPTGDAA